VPAVPATPFGWRHRGTVHLTNLSSPDRHLVGQVPRWALEDPVPLLFSELRAAWRFHAARCVLRDRRAARPGQRYHRWPSASNLSTCPDSTSSTPSPVGRSSAGYPRPYRHLSIHGSGPVSPEAPQPGQDVPVALRALVDPWTGWSPWRRRGGSRPRRGPVPATTRRPRGQSPGLQADARELRRAPSASRRSPRPRRPTVLAAIIVSTAPGRAVLPRGLPPPWGRRWTTRTQQPKPSRRRSVAATKAAHVRRRVLVAPGEGPGQRVDHDQRRAPRRVGRSRDEVATSPRSRKQPGTITNRARAAPRAPAPTPRRGWPRPPAPSPAR
jgi:hypothetical protein